MPPPAKPTIHVQGRVPMAPRGVPPTAARTQPPTTPPTTPPLDPPDDDLPDNPPPTTPPVVPPERDKLSEIFDQFMTAKAEELVVSFADAVVSSLGIDPANMGDILRKAAAQFTAHG